MWKQVKKMVVISITIVLCFVFVTIVNAQSTRSDLNYGGNFVRVTVEDMGPDFTMRIYGYTKTGSPVVETQAGRRMFNLVWYDSGKYNQTISTLNYYYYCYGSGNGTYDTRATWTNKTSGTKLNANFALY